MNTNFDKWGRSWGSNVTHVASLCRSLDELRAGWGPELAQEMLNWDWATTGNVARAILAKLETRTIERSI